jgi:hypothetical protein
MDSAVMLVACGSRDRAGTETKSKGRVGFQLLDIGRLNRDTIDSLFFFRATLVEIANMIGWTYGRSFSLCVRIGMVRVLDVAKRGYDRQFSIISSDGCAQLLGSLNKKEKPFETLLVYSQVRANLPRFHWTR